MPNNKEAVVEPEGMQRLQFFTKEQNLVQLIVFTLGEEEFGVRIDDVREIIRTKTIIPIPDSPEFIKGIINVRGEVIMVIDLKSRFFLYTKQEMESRHIIITREEKSPFGLLVSEVTEVLRIPQERIKKAPGLVTRIREKYLSGVLTLDDRMIIILELKEVLSEDELVNLAKLQRKHRETETAGSTEVKEYPREQTGLQDKEMLCLQKAAKSRKKHQKKISQEVVD